MAKRTHGESLNLVSASTTQQENPVVPEHGQESRSEQPRQPYPTLTQKERRQRMTRRIVIPIISVLVIILLAGVGIGWWYTSQLDKALGYDDTESAAALKEILVSKDINEPFYVLLLGSDSREGNLTTTNEENLGSNQRSDVMILVRVDPISKQLTLVSIPRDTPIYDRYGNLERINEAYNQGGASESVAAVSALTGVDIAHVVEVRFSDLENIVDDLGGVTVTVDTEMGYKDALTGEYVSLEPGEQVINGQQAQIFARARKDYAEDQDFHRQNNVRQLGMAILKKALDRPLTELTSTILMLANCVDTDMTTMDVLSLAKDFAPVINTMTVYSVSGPSDGDFMEEHNGLWYCYENPEAWKRLMALVDAGEDPNSVDWLSDPAETASETIADTGEGTDVVAFSEETADAGAWAEPVVSVGSPDGYYDGEAWNGEEYWYNEAMPSPSTPQDIVPSDQPADASQPTEVEPSTEPTDAPVEGGDVEQVPTSPDPVVEQPSDTSSEQAPSVTPDVTATSTSPMAEAA